MIERAQRFVEVVVVFDDAMLDVRYLGPGRRFCVGPTEAADFAWPEPLEIVRVERDGCIVPAANAEPLEPQLDGDELGFQVTLGRLCLRVRPTTPPESRGLSPRFSSRVGVALLPLLFAFAGAGLGAMRGGAGSLALDPALAHRVRVTLELTPHHNYAPPRPSRRHEPPRTVPNPFFVGQAWSGTYFCPQGETELVLAITGVHGDEIEAAFIFDYAHTTRGRFDLHGKFSAVNGHTTFAAGAWSSRPTGYYTVGLDGNVTGDVYAGRVDGIGCSTFSLRRARLER